METGRGRVDRFAWGEEVMIGGRGGWLGLDVGEETAGGGEVAGEEVADMAVVMFERSQAVGTSRAMSQMMPRDRAVSTALPVPSTSLPQPKANVGRSGVERCR